MTIGLKTSTDYTPQVECAAADRPLILIAPRWEDDRTGPEPYSPNESVAQWFMEAIHAAGGMALTMAIDNDHDDVIDAYVQMADGIAIPGGPDVNPARWGDTNPYDPTLCCEIRDAFEFRLVQAAIAAKRPIFTTCRGTQLLNVALGGTLCMDVPSLGACDGMVQWRHLHALNEPVHPVDVREGSLLQRAVGGAAQVQTNSAHHCCVAKLGTGVVLSGRATDGVPEAIEVEGQPFCLGVQWHPEYTWRKIESDFNLWRAFVEAAAKVKAAR